MMFRMFSTTGKNKADETRGFAPHPAKDLYKAKSCAFCRELLFDPVKNAAFRYLKAPLPEEAELLS